MARTLLHLGLVAVVVAFGVAACPGTAEARRPICELEPLLSLPDARPAPVALVASALAGSVDDDRPERAVRAAAPIDRNVCRSFLGEDDPACWPSMPASAPGRFIPLAATDSLLRGPAPPLLPPPSARLARWPEDSRPLAGGHGRRLERPPRSSSVS